ncbi:MAG TPA: hypothetical protein ENG87_03960 [Candidatus Pacearchaeota archaeon]|nr:hypothetical protein [Candidatus Pacearchaeota archaeon]
MLAKLNRILKYLIMASLIVLTFLSVYYKYDDCSKCDFEYRGHNYDAGKFMNIYADKCFQVDDQTRKSDIPFGNITIED